MTLHINTDVDDSHAAVAALLPWLLTGTLAPAEQAMVERHLLTCQACRDDLAWQRAFQQAMPVPAVPGDAEAALAKLRPRLHVEAHRPARRQPIATGRPWLAWLACGQAAAIAVLALLLYRPPPPDYRALGADDIKTGDLVVQFRPETSERELRRILQTNGVRISAGPTVSDAWVLVVTGDEPRAVLHRLRQERAVLLAEPLTR